MSLASYICMERQIPEKYLNLDEEDETLPLYIGPSFADKDCLYEVKTRHFHKWYVYEISSDWGIEIVEPFDSSISKESKEKLRYLFTFMNDFLDEGESFELYTCWIGEESYPQEKSMTLSLELNQLEDIEIPERTHILITKQSEN
ncbi:hypothetical protein A0126_16725 (plasmid) [Exiguobacterium sp. N4-1P]|uniref:hypothetical protein n=1 Tax=Exiguobacterium sp. N4-1P TaxID=2051906 RepID=UPI000B597074|nr:hypothetical protein [Exiguobacterium sp. N4-1P]ASI35221.1 hypothetical protein A0126_06450 [Exiguobacterium sp. N4-1P]ASI37234.1 hypothetical protein A0126_16725 [Exiguobacterium sp. N4-1P]